MYSIEVALVEDLTVPTMFSTIHLKGAFIICDVCCQSGVLWDNFAFLHVFDFVVEGLI